MFATTRLPSGAHAGAMSSESMTRRAPTTATNCDPDINAAPQDLSAIWKPLRRWSCIGEITASPTPVMASSITAVGSDRHQMRPAAARMKVQPNSAGGIPLPNE